ncbi:hypothetical protein DXG03_001048 [Asterophora parasitica]|uniref:Uncharacterized protein n=1 Tax=Asterophora parasitica TaxID=117018 RepID=A0A9P7FXW5_9AGAR|nr:hypothetical protein DXG03_001048 [Asterophora parasitica]
MKVNCWAAGSGKEGQGLKSKGKDKDKDTAGAAKSKDAESDKAWMVMAEANIMEFMEEVMGSDPFVGLTDFDEGYTASEDDIKNTFLFEHLSLPEPSLPKPGPKLDDDGILNLFTDGCETDKETKILSHSKDEMLELYKNEHRSTRDSGDNNSGGKDSGSAEEGNSEFNNEYFDVLRGTDNCQLLGLRDEAYTNTFAAAALSKDVQENPNLINVKLYNSGASCHMSGL